MNLPDVMPLATGNHSQIKPEGRKRRRRAWSLVFHNLDPKPRLFASRPYGVPSPFGLGSNQTVGLTPTTYIKTEFLPSPEGLRDSPLLLALDKNVIPILIGMTIDSSDNRIGALAVQRRKQVTVQLC